MSNFTKGPWSWSSWHLTSDGRKTMSLIGADGYGILSCDGLENSPSQIFADLLQAAPDLYEALDYAVSNWTSEFDYLGAKTPAWVIEARAALAKAKGTAP